MTLCQRRSLMSGSSAFIRLSVIWVLATGMAGSPARASQPALPEAEAPARPEAAMDDPAIEARKLIEAGQTAPIARELRQSQDWKMIGALATLLIKPGATDLLSDRATLDALAGRLGQARTDVKVAILMALAGDFDQSAVRAVVSLLDDEDPSLRARAMRTLLSQTGRADLGADPAAWKQWWTRHEWLPEREWLRRVANWQTRRARQATKQAAEAETRLVDALHELYSITPADDRPALLVRLLGDTSPSVKRLGVELASREIVNATPLPAKVLDAAAEVLSDPRADLRAGGARLLGAVGPNDHLGRVSEALSAERDATAAAAMLDVIAVSKATQSGVASALRWIGDPVAGSSAARVLLGAIDSGELEAPAFRNAAWRAVANDAGVSLGAIGVELFGRLAPTLKLGDLSRLLDSPDRALGEASAKALAARRRGLGPLLDAAQRDPALTPIAIDAIERWNPSASGWRWARELAGASENDLTALADSLPPKEAIIAAGKEPSPAYRLMLLSRFQPPASDNAGISKADLTRALTLRTRSLLDLGRFEAALKEVDQSSDRVGRRALEPIRGVALLTLGRVDDAVEAGASGREWLEALELLIASDSPLAAELLRSLDERKTVLLSEAEHLRFEKLRGELSVKEGAIPKSKKLNTPRPDKGQTAQLQ